MVLEGQLCTDGAGHKSLYGLKEMLYEWHSMMDKHLCDIHVELSKVDPCLYI
jgi:hypothetical protein